MRLVAVLLILGCSSTPPTAEPTTGDEIDEPAPTHALWELTVRHRLESEGTWSTPAEERAGHPLASEHWVSGGHLPIGEMARHVGCTLTYFAASVTIGCTELETRTQASLELQCQAGESVFRFSRTAGEGEIEITFSCSLGGLDR